MPYLQQDDPASTRHSIGKQVTIGRGADNDIVLPDDMRASRRHAAVSEQNQEWVLEDLGSRNGTYLNDKSVKVHPLRHGDRIKVGNSRFLFSAETDPMATLAETRESRSGRDLSSRESEVLALLCRGSTDQQIADSLVISLATVRSHLDRIRDKTGCRRRTELTRLAIELGLDK